MPLALYNSRDKTKRKAITAKPITMAVKIKACGNGSASKPVRLPFAGSMIGAFRLFRPAAVRIMRLAALDKIIAPNWMYNSGFEWVFRLIQEPKRLWKRYLISNIYWLYRLIKSS